MRAIVFVIGMILISVGTAHAQKDVQDFPNWWGGIDKKVKDTIKERLQGDRDIGREIVPIKKTHLQVILEVKGNYSKPGDKFDAIISVKNDGYEDALATRIFLRGVPQDWEVNPVTRSAAIGTIKPGDTEKRTFEVRRGEINSTIYAVALAQNAPEASSNTFAVSISWFVVPFALIFGFMIYRRWSKR